MTSQFSDEVEFVECEKDYVLLVRSKDNFKTTEINPKEIHAYEDEISFINTLENQMEIEGEALHESNIKGQIRF